jgi:hypothetical protein
MSARANKTLQPANPVQMDSHAAATLRYIRASMEAASSLTVPGSAATAVGIVGTLAAALSYVPALRPHWLIVWLVAAVVASGIGGALMMQQFVHGRSMVIRGPMRKFALCASPSLFAGAALTAVLWRAGNLDAIPGTWLTLYGCALIGASAVSDATIGKLGGAFFVSGLLALLLPDRFHIPLLGIAFGGLHICFGVLMRRTGHGGEI